jgi:hypothetical protein
MRNICQTEKRLGHAITHSHSPALDIQYAPSFLDTLELLVAATERAG